MKKEDLIKNIAIEIERLNRKIDLKIIKGLAYKKEAKQHKFLLAQLQDLTREKFASMKVTTKKPAKVSLGFFAKTAHFVSAFVF